MKSEILKARYGWKGELGNKNRKDKIRKQKS
jgi:hypothetical protein